MLTFFQAASSERTFMSSDGLLKALNDSQRYLDIVHKPQLTRSEAEWLVETTVNNFAKYYNSGFIEYRKSVAEAGDFAAVEWTGRGATFKDVLGREYIDCLGGLASSILAGRIKKSWLPYRRSYKKARFPHRNCLIPCAACSLICWRKLRPVIFNTASS